MSYRRFSVYICTVADMHIYPRLLFVDIITNFKNLISGVGGWFRPMILTYGSHGCMQVHTCADVCSGLQLSRMTSVLESWRLIYEALTGILGSALTYTEKMQRNPGSRRSAEPCMCSDVLSAESRFGLCRLVHEVGPGGRAKWAVAYS